MRTGEDTISQRDRTVEVRLLGGVDVVVDGIRVSIGGAKPRALMALLALQPDIVVSVDRMVDAVWGEIAPPTVRSSLQVHISNIRRSLTDAGLAPFVQTREGGYVFVADPATVDVHRFADEAREAREAFTAGNMETALVSARKARTLWRGAPLAGIGDAPFVASRVVSLEETFLSLVELYADIEIALGRPAEAVGELEQVVAAHPYRETAWARLAVALYRSGRQVDALDRLKTVRRVLAEDLGLDPSPDVAALELAILNQDPALRGDTAFAPAPPGASSETLLADSRLPPARLLIGRDELVGSVVDALRVTRLVTIIGPGGAGKTSAAVAAAATVSGTGAASARFIDLSTLQGSEGVVPSVMASVGVRGENLDDAEDDLVSTLNAYTDPLLVFDNCEHVLDAVASMVVRLLARCPALRVLATSRSRLSVLDEMVITCPPLPVEHATELFVARAQAIDREYIASDAERDAIGTMVERLDGLPLAVELFAARVVSLSAIEMLARFDDDAMLTTAWRSSHAERHRSMQDVVSWSYTLLDEEERSCLRQMSLFGGSVNAAGVREVCQPARMSVLDHLVASSLVIAERTVAGTRYRMLATVRAFAAAELARSPEHVAARRRFVDWATAWARTLADGFASADPSAAIDELEANAANVRVAHQLALEIEPDQAAAAHLLAALGPWGPSFTPVLPESVTWARTALLDPEIADADRLVLLIVVARLTNVGTDECKARLREAMRLAEALGDEAGLAAAWAAYSLAATDIASEGLSAAERAIDLALVAQQPVTLAFGLNIAVTELIRLRRFDEATELLDRHCVAGTQRFGAHEALVRFQRGRLAMLLGDLDAASTEFSAAEQAATRTKSFGGMSAAWYGQAEVDRLSGRIEAAYHGYRRCLPLDLVVDPGETGLVRMMIVWTACLLGELHVAEHHTGVLADEMALERRVTEGATMIEAVAVGAQGLLALAKGTHSLADTTLRRAIRLWAESHSWDVVADLLDRLAELDDEPAAAANFHAIAAGVRTGSTSLDQALASMELSAPGPI